MRLLYLLCAGVLISSCGLSHGLDLPSGSTEEDGSSDGTGFASGSKTDGDGSETNIGDGDVGLATPGTPGAAASGGTSGVIGAAEDSVNNLGGMGGAEEASVGGSAAGGAAAGGTNAGGSGGSAAGGSASGGSTAE